MASQKRQPFFTFKFLTFSSAGSHESSDNDEP